MEGWRENKIKVNHVMRNDDVGQWEFDQIRTNLIILLYKFVDHIVHKVGQAVEDNVQAEEKIYRNLITTVMN
jgi:hypothetical protein